MEKDMQILEGYMESKTDKIPVNITYEWDENRKSYRMFTDCFKYGNHLELIFDNDRQCFVIKNFKNIKKNWNKKQGISDDPFDKFMELEDGMQDM